MAKNKQPLVAGVDVGGTNIEVGLVDLDERGQGVLGLAERNDGHGHKIAQLLAGPGVVKLLGVAGGQVLVRRVW